MFIWILATHDDDNGLCVSVHKENCDAQCALRGFIDPFGEQADLSNADFESWAWDHSDTSFTICRREIN